MLFRSRSLLSVLSEQMAESPHIGFYLSWCLNLLNNHGQYLHKQSYLFLTPFRALQKAITSQRQDIAKLFAYCRCCCWLSFFLLFDLMC